MPVSELPPLPPTGGGQGSPTYTSMLGQPEQAPDAGAGAGLSQTGGAAMRLGMELDASMKLLAQMVPQLAAWAEQASTQLKLELGRALTTGSIPTGAEPPENTNFPDGRGRL